MTEQQPLENQVNDSESQSWAKRAISTARNLALPLGTAAVAGAAVFTGAEIFNESGMTYKLDPVVIEAGAISMVAGGVTAHKYAGKVRDGIKWLADKAMSPVSKLLSRGEDPKLVQNAFRSRKMKGCAALTLVGIIGAAVTHIEGGLPTTVNGKPALQWIKTKYDELEFITARKNFRFLGNYVFGSPLDGVPIPPSDLKPPEGLSYSADGSTTFDAFNDWHEREFGLRPKSDRYATRKTADRGWGVVAFLQEEGEWTKPVYFFEEPPNSKLSRVIGGSFYYVFEGQIIGQAVNDYDMMPQREPICDKQLDLVRGKLYYTTLELPEDYIEEGSEELTLLTIREFDPKTKSFGPCRFGTPRLCVTSFPREYYTADQPGGYQRALFGISDDNYERVITIGVRGENGKPKILFVNEEGKIRKTLEGYCTPQRTRIFLFDDN